MAALKNPAAFFVAVRRLTGPLNQVQVNTIQDLLVAASHWPISYVAYGLATAWHEARLRPIHEKGSGDGPDPDKWDDHLQRYDTGKLAKQLGNTPEADGDGVRYAGRGLVQLTGTANYRKAGAALGVDLLKNPDLALRPDIATKILVWGMETGAFTGRRLSHYLLNEPANFEAFKRCRRIINGTDRDAKIADYALTFQNALTLGAWSA